MAAGHLVKRFFGSLRPGGPSKTDDAWAHSHLSDAEAKLWRRMSNPDRRHAVGVARRVERALGSEATDPILAAALLHDVGKTVSHLRTYGRVVATLSAKVAGHEMAVAWSETRGFTRRVGLYLEHPRLGGDLLALAESDPLTIAWAREHHGSEDDWTIPVAIGRVLEAADDD
ncbi:MAG TPA: hypothetical protein VFN21_11150 [Acidimicrobiales bacterium]|nr:hypothetical protein [Acidimicrobiales bacterium]